MFGPKKFWVNKFRVPTKIKGSKKFGSKKNFGTKQILGPKNVDSEKNWGLKKSKFFFGSNRKIKSKIILSN